MIKLFDEPFITYYEHELDGKRFVCLGDDCPPCDIGDKPTFVALTSATDLAGIGPRPA